MSYETSSYELRLPPGLLSSPLDEYCFALVALSFEYSSKESSDDFSNPDLENCFLHTDFVASDCTWLCTGLVLVSSILTSIPLSSAVHCKFHIALN